MSWFDTSTKEGRDDLRRHLERYTVDDLAAYIKRWHGDIPAHEDRVREAKARLACTCKRVELAREMLRLKSAPQVIGDTAPGSHG